MSFFEDEVREGFYITNMMKRYWAAQLQVLSRIDEVCKKHGLKWFADCGTLLGAVRHRGYIPWDDDLDICMLRHDYEVFFKVAVDELPKGYRVLTIHTENEYRELFGRVVNSNSIKYSPEHLKAMVIRGIWLICAPKKDTCDDNVCDIIIWLRVILS